MNLDENRELFLEEAADLLERLERALLELERDTSRLDLVNDIFRALHTIKGSGAMFGFDNVSKFSHQFENLFDDIRKGILSVTPEIISESLGGVDAIRTILERDAPTEESSRIEAWISRVREAAGGHRAVPTPPVAANPPPPDENTEPGECELPAAFRISFKPSPDILTRGVRVEALLSELASLGEFELTADLTRVPPLDSIDPTGLYLEWNCTLATDKCSNDVRSVFIFVEDYAEIGIREIALQEEDGRIYAPRIGEVLSGRGKLDPGQIEDIRKGQPQFGEVAVKSGLISQSELDAALAEQRIVKAVATEREVRQESATVRVRKEKLDYLVDAVGELVILQARLMRESKESGLASFTSLAENLSRLTSVLRDASMSIRMVPLEDSFSGFRRLVRDIATNLGKDVKLEIIGASTELDKNLVEYLKDPLVHIIRNSVDHGIEAPAERVRAGKPAAGTVTLSAAQYGSSVKIEVKDDGAGLNIGKIKARAVERRLLDPGETDVDRITSMIFEPGFSTAEKTTNISGRGVGMDVVRTNVERMQGEVTIASEEGKGTRITLTIPLTLVIVDGLLVKVGDNDYVITLSLVDQCLDFTREYAAALGQQGFISLRDRAVPVLDLGDILNGRPIGESLDARLVIANVDGNEVAFLVDAVTGKQQVVIKPFTAAMKNIRTISGATILGDGSVGLILNTNELVKHGRKALAAT